MPKLILRILFVWLLDVCDVEWNMMMMYTLAYLRRVDKYIYIHYDK